MSFDFRPFVSMNIYVVVVAFFFYFVSWFLFIGLTLALAKNIDVDLRVTRRYKCQLKATMAIWPHQDVSHLG